MFSVGQEVSTRYGIGVVVCVGSVNSHIYVRLRSRSEIYILKESDIGAIETKQPDMCKLDEVIDQTEKAEEQNDRETYGLAEARPASPIRFNNPWRGQMRNTRLVEQTPLSIFVRERLAELEMRQSEFCRLTGFDQGLLSKIQSSMITNLSLESALRLAVGLSVSPKKILALIGRMDMHDLSMRAYAADLSDLTGVNADGLPAPVLEVKYMALRAHQMGRSLAPVVKVLASLAAMPGEQTKIHSGEELFITSGRS